MLRHPRDPRPSSYRFSSSYHAPHPLTTAQVINFLMPHVVDLNTLVPGIAAMPPETQLQSLQQALKPYMLRNERDAAQRAQLPPAELWVPCALPPVQRDCIKTLLARFYDVLTDAKLPRYSGHKAGQFRTICGELRKMCSHPLLVPEVFDQDDVANGLPDYLAASGKLQLLDRMLRVLQQQGKRVAVASQSPKVFDVLKMPIDYCALVVLLQTVLHSLFQKYMA